MRSERLLGIAAPFLRGLPVVGFGLLAAGALAYTLQSHPGGAGHEHRVPFELRADPGTQTIRSGATASYSITIRRAEYHGPIWLTATPSRGLPPLTGPDGTASGNRIKVLVYRRSALVEVKTDPKDDPGTYSVRLRAVGGHYRSVLTLGLVIVAPKPVPFAIKGDFGTLWPGGSEALNLLLTNPNAQTISVRSVTVGLRDVSAPHASPALPCSTGDFVVTQFAGAYPLVLPGHASRRLSDLDVPAPLWPRIAMLNRPVNQNGCRGATVTVAYSGRATSP